MTNEKIPTVYCINFNDHNRRKKMTRRFQTLNLPYHFTEPVYKTDPRLNHSDINKKHKRTYSIMLQHLDSLRHYLDNTSDTLTIINFPDYSNSNTYKPILSRSNKPNYHVEQKVGLWRNTNAITSITVFSTGSNPNFASGSTFTLYGIKAE